MAPPMIRAVLATLSKANANCPRYVFIGPGGFDQVALESCMGDNGAAAERVSMDEPRL